MLIFPESFARHSVPFCSQSILKSLPFSCSVTVLVVEERGGRLIVGNIVACAFQQSSNAIDLRSQMTTTFVDPVLDSLGDEALIDMTLAGQNGCFDVLMDRHLGTVRKRVHAMIRDFAQAEDVVQEVQLKTWTHLSSFRADSSFRTWITRIAINESLQSHRRAKAQHRCDGANLDQFAASGESPLTCYARREMAGTVRRAIHRLPAQFRQILILRDLRELTIEETARHLKSSRPLVKSRLLRARIMLSKALQQHRKKPFPDWRGELAA
jgi:RNA polymerase sigma-70 factor (ECF subfamily)